MNEKYVIFTIGLALGCLLMGLATSMQPRKIDITFPKGFEAKLLVEAIDNCSVHGGCDE